MVEKDLIYVPRSNPVGSGSMVRLERLGHSVDQWSEAEWETPARGHIVFF